MKFDQVCRDLAEHAIQDALDVFELQRSRHDFKPFSCERQVITDGGSKFKIKVEFEPDPMEALMRAVGKN